MERIRSWVAAALLVTPGVLVGCEEESADQACVPNQSVACTCWGGAPSAMLCAPDGSGFGQCICNVAGAGGVGGAGGQAGVAGMAGWGGVGGTAGLGGTGGVSGMGGTGSVSGTGGMAGMAGMAGLGGMGGTAGVGGTSGTGGTAGTGGTGGMSGTGGTAGTGGTGGMSGTGGSGGSTSNDVPGGDYCSDAATWDGSWSQWEQDVLRLTNEARAAGHNCDSEGNFGPAGPLTMKAELRCSARLHSKDMAERGYFAHDSAAPDGRDPFERMADAGYSGGTMGENIAAGQTSPEQVVNGWLDSDGHCANIMNPDFTELGVGYFRVSGNYRHYWTQNFGGPGGWGF